MERRVVFKSSSSSKLHFEAKKTRIWNEKRKTKDRGRGRGREHGAMIHATPAPTARDTSAQAIGLGNDGE